MKYYSFVLFLVISFVCNAQVQIGKDSDVHKWIYAINVDRMTSDTSYIAEVEAKEEVDFGAAHKPEKATLIAISSSKNTSVGLNVGVDFVHDANNSGKVLIRIDNRKAFEADYITKSGSGTIFFSDAFNLVDEFRNANVILIKADFIVGSEKIIEFDATPLSKRRFKSVGLKQSQDNWSYDMQVDKMSSDTSYTATCNIKGRFTLASNGNNATAALFGIIYNGGANKLVVVIGGGKYDFNKSALSGRIRFDDEQPISIQCSETNSPGQIFIDNPAALVAKLKQSKKVLLEIPFQQEGSKVMEFDTHGLVWNHVSAK